MLFIVMAQESSPSKAGNSNNDDKDNKHADCRESYIIKHLGINLDIPQSARKPLFSSGLMAILALVTSTYMPKLSVLNCTLLPSPNLCTPLISLTVPSSGESLYTLKKT